MTECYGSVVQNIGMYGLDYHCFSPKSCRFPQAWHFPQLCVCVCVWGGGVVQEYIENVLMKYIWVMLSRHYNA